MRGAGNYAEGFIHGTGADQNVPIGFIPTFVEVWNWTDGDKIFANAIDKVVAFTSGGTTEVKQGDLLTGRTSGAYGRVKQVILDSGSWAGGDAAGWFIFDAPSITGAFGSEGANLNGVSADAVTIALQDNDGIDIDTEVAATTTDDTNVSHYAGSTTEAPGFKMGATVSENAKLLYFRASRYDGPAVNQTTVW